MGSDVDPVSGEVHDSERFIKDLRKRVKDSEAENIRLKGIAEMFFAFFSLPQCPAINKTSDSASPSYFASRPLHTKAAKSVAKLGKNLFTHAIILKPDSASIELTDKLIADTMRNID